jgi:hypothetical protein
MLHGSGVAVAWCKMPCTASVGSQVKISKMQKRTISRSMQNGYLIKKLAKSVI